LLRLKSSQYKIATEFTLYFAKYENSEEQQKNSEITAGVSLFFRRPNRRRPRLSAANEIPLADNLSPKQRKQQKTERSMMPPGGHGRTVCARVLLWMVASR
jgi:hypothetical protein